MPDCKACFWTGGLKSEVQHGPLNFIIEYFFGSLKAETGARHGVEALGYFFEIVALVRAQIDALGQILPHGAVRVFVRWTAPRAVRITEIDLDF